MLGVLRRIDRALAPVTNVLMICVGFVLYTFTDLLFAFVVVLTMAAAVVGFYDVLILWLSALVR